ncbi:aminotransferase class I/II-fold pyridoxal phosphate-dependent enzyme [uncultured Umboniibacter sp.]|uniref:aminotransferase class I/II-fold pyridoxal phosphate-dependent enzyme n=1 Tax=uncultured Umboniibacter sp. TaxID=1798917 RepID=UPI00262C2EFB|nr:aminotransferase class I/II-fold pyridoxal phosphate-dependent enzyme [uncultured Umboniibacter sp.]
MSEQPLGTLSAEDLTTLYTQYQSKQLALDLTRGKPSAKQLSLADRIDGILDGNYLTSGTDTRNYGGLEGIAEIKPLGSWLLDTPESAVIAGGNSSLTMMYQTVLFQKLFNPAWQGDISFLCPTPGYDRHFSICEELGINMVPVPFRAGGPDMDAVEALVANDTSIKGIWCVPKYQNPTGVTFDDATVKRIANLGNLAGDGFIVLWDNAYAVHHLDNNRPDVLADFWALSEAAGTLDSAFLFASTSKISHAGSGVAFMACSESQRAFFLKHLGMSAIGPDKVGQLRHVALFPTKSALANHMALHAELIKPRMEMVVNKLDQHLNSGEQGEWTRPNGGYFVTFYAPEGTATKIVALAAELGVKLTPAGATHPYGNDESDSVIRLAPSFPTIAELDEAMDAFCLCVAIATAK